MGRNIKLKPRINQWLSSLIYTNPIRKTIQIKSKIRRVNIIVKIKGQNITITEIKRIIRTIRKRVW